MVVMLYSIQPKHQKINPKIRRIRKIKAKTFPFLIILIKFF